MIDSGAIDFVDHIAVETHERQIPQLLPETDALRRRIQAEGLSPKVRLIGLVTSNLRGIKFVEHELLRAA